MLKTCVAIAALTIIVGASGASAQTYSTGAVNTYSTCGLNPDLSNRIEAAKRFREWYDLNGFPNVSRWENDNVFNTDFTDGPGKDMDPGGGSDAPNIYLFSGHGSCQNPPGANDPDFLVTCSHTVGNFTDIGVSSRWGNAGGNLRFACIDASCPMDLVSLGHNWFPPFQGLHVATGHSGRTTNDTLDSPSRPAEFAANTIGRVVIFGADLISIIPKEPVTWAWMDSGLVDVQPQVCAVSIANDATRDAAIFRRDNEFVRPSMGPPSGNWYAWRWVCN
jgi:Family of unknown function (DUF6345)